MKKADELYYNNGGKGPGIARIVSIENGIVYLEYKKTDKAKRWQSTKFSEEFFESSSCGWRKRGRQ